MSSILRSCLRVIDSFDLDEAAQPIRYLKTPSDAPSMLTWYPDLCCACHADNLDAGPYEKLNVSSGLCMLVRGWSGNCIVLKDRIKAGSWGSAYLTYTNQSDQLPFDDLIAQKLRSKFRRSDVG